MRYKKNTQWAKSSVFQSELKLHYGSNFVSFSKIFKVNFFFVECEAFCASHSKIYANNFKILEIFKKNVSPIGETFQLEK
mgnify:CR=1 FL=1